MLMRFLLCLLCCSASAQPNTKDRDADDSFIYEECGRVISDKSQARECLDLTDSDSDALLPVVLETTISQKEFICGSKLPLYSFQCTLYGDELIWYYNHQTVTSFHPSDTLGRMNMDKTFETESGNVYVVAILTYVSKGVNFDSPLCVSTLTIQPYNETEFEALPFTVACQTFCKGYNRSKVCQTKHFDLAATPSIPREVIGNITSTPKVGGNIAAVNWLPPENVNKTTIHYYELTLNGSNTSSTTVKVDAAVSLPYTFVLPKGNFTTVSVTAVDVCGQRSESASNILNDNSGNTGVNKLSPDIMEQTVQQQGPVVGFATAFALTLVVTLILCALVIGALYYISKQKKTGKLKTNRKGEKVNTGDNIKFEVPSGSVKINNVEED